MLITQRLVLEADLPRYTRIEEVPFKPALCLQRAERGSEWAVERVLAGIGV
jgi:hypothetical protein